MMCLQSDMMILLPRSFKPTHTVKQIPTNVNPIYSNISTDVPIINLCVIITECLESGNIGRVLHGKWNINIAWPWLYNVCMCAQNALVNVCMVGGVTGLYHLYLRAICMGASHLIERNVEEYYSLYCFQTE